MKKFAASSSSHSGTYVHALRRVVTGPSIASLAGTFMSAEATVTYLTLAKVAAPTIADYGDSHLLYSH
jgi:hypothetical protein